MPLAVGRMATRAGAAGMAAGLATIAGQITYVARKALPEHPDLDATGPVGSAAGPPVRVVVLGDSSCTGPGLDHPDEIWIRQLAARFEGRAFDVRSFAVGGSQAHDVLAGQLPAALGARPELAVVSVGANDALHGRGWVGLQARLARIVDRLLTTVDSVVLPGVGDVGTAPRIPFPLSATATGACRRADHAHRRVAAERARVHKAPMWDTTPVFRTRTDIWSSDDYHPNGRGHAVWADAVEATFARAIDDVDRARGRGRRPGATVR